MARAGSHRKIPSGGRKSSTDVAGVVSSKETEALIELLDRLPVVDPEVVAALAIVNAAAVELLGCTPHNDVDRQDSSA